MKYLSLALPCVAFFMSGVDAFAPQPPLHQACASSKPVAAPLHSSVPADDDNNNNNQGADALAMEFGAILPLALKMSGVLALKTFKDVLNYPPMFLDQALRRQPDEDQLPQTSPVAMLFKLIGVLTFKVIHDSVYFPMVWSKKLLEPRSMDE